MNDKKKNDFKLTEYATHGAAYAAGTALLLATGGTEYPMLKFLGYSVLYFLFGAVVISVGTAAAIVATEKGGKWVKLLKFVAAMAAVGTIFYMFAGGKY